MKLFLLFSLILLFTWFGPTTAQDEALKRAVSVLPGTYSSPNATSRASKMVVYYLKIDKVYKPGTITLILEEYKDDEIVDVSYLQYCTEGDRFVMRPSLIKAEWLSKNNLTKDDLSNLTHEDLIEGEGCTKDITFSNSPPYHGQWPQWPICFVSVKIPSIDFVFDCAQIETIVPKFGTFIFSKDEKSVSPILEWKPAEDPCP